MAEKSADEKGSEAAFLCLFSKMSKAAWLRPQNACTLCVAVQFFQGAFCPLFLDMLMLAENQLLSSCRTMTTTPMQSPVSLGPFS